VAKIPPKVVPLRSAKRNGTIFGGIMVTLFIVAPLVWPACASLDQAWISYLLVPACASQAATKRSRGLLMA